MSINSSLKTLAETTNLYPYRKLYLTMERNLAGGSALSDTLKSYDKSHHLLESTTVQLIGSGERSGSLPKTLAVLANHYSKRVERASDTLDKALEPFLITVVALGVAFMATSIMLPIYSMFGSFNGQLASNNQVKPVKSLSTQEIAALPKVIIKPRDLSESLPGRQAPDTSGKVIVRLKAGETLPVRTEQASWIELLINDNYGVWVPKEDVKAK